MQTNDLIAGFPRALLGVAANRWGLSLTTRRSIAASLREPRVASRVCRRGADAGAAQLVRLLVEYGGEPVPPLDELAQEAQRLRGWFPFVESTEGYRVASDFAAAAQRVAEAERMFAATLVMRLDRESGDALLRDVGDAGLGSREARLLAAAERIASSAAAPPELAAATAAAGAVPVRDIKRVTYVPGSQGTHFRVHTSGRPLEVTFREVAARAGQRFAPPAVVVPEAGREGAGLSLRVLPIVEIGAVVTFGSGRAADAALALLDFRRLVARRIDERRVATVADCAESRAQEVLERLGFVLDDEALS
jgi:hypothetical protein